MANLMSFKALAWCWGGGIAAAGAGAVALQVTAPAPEPAVAAPVAAVPALISVPLPGPAPVPFQNHSLLAMLPPAGERAARPPVHAAGPVAQPLPLPPAPPAPPVQHLARAEPRRAVPVYYPPEPQPEYPRWGWGRPMRYPGQYASARAYYPYAAPPPYYGWRPYD